jgi:hypothetical protein
VAENGGWVVPWKVYVDQRFEDNAKLYDERDLASQRALIERTTSLEHRLEGMNAIREQLREQAATFMSRIEIQALLEKSDIIHGEFDKRLEVIQRSQDQAEGRRTVVTVIVAAGVSIFTAAVAGIIVGIVFYFGHH